MKVKGGVGGCQSKASEKMEAGFKGRPTKGIERMESKGRQAREEQEDGGRSRRPSGKGDRDKVCWLG